MIRGSSDWADAKLAERQAFNRISEARSQADWLKAWQTWTSTLERLRRQARYPDPALAAEAVSEFESQSEQSVQRSYTNRL
jgi:hypothetical protein